MRYNLKSVYGNYHVDLGIVTNKEGIDMLLANSAVKELRRAGIAELYKMEKNDTFLSVDDRYYLKITDVTFRYLEDNGVFDVLDVIPYRETLLIGEDYTDIKQTFKRPMPMAVYNNPSNNDPIAYLSCKRTIEPRFECTCISEDIDTATDDKQKPNSAKLSDSDIDKLTISTLMAHINKLEETLSSLQVQINELDGRVRRIGGIVGTS